MSDQTKVPGNINSLQDRINQEAEKKVGEELYQFASRLNFITDHANLPKIYLKNDAGEFVETNLRSLFFVRHYSGAYGESESYDATGEFARVIHAANLPRAIEERTNAFLNLHYQGLDAISELETLQKQLEGPAEKNPDGPY